MHYALVSDLLTKEEFDKRVENKCQELGGAVDEVCAAMLVVEELGRSHVKISEIKNTATVLISFFGKILEINPPCEFRREGDGEGTEPGLMASIVLGDPTGTAMMTLWDAMAAAVSELEVGSVLEVIAKPRHSYRNEVTCAALRPSQVTIVETKKPPKSETMKVPFAAKVLHIRSVQEITRRDGSVSEFQEILVGDPSGTARIITWEPELFANLDEGVSVSFTGLARKEDGDSVEYIADDSVVITPYAEPIKVLTGDAGDVAEGQTSVVTGVVRSVSPIRTFTTHNGTESRVKNIKLGSESGHGYVNVACWNEAADTAVFAGDKLEVINAPAKLNKYGDVELSVGRSAVLRDGICTEFYTEFEGFVIPRCEGITIDNGTQALLLVTDRSLDLTARIRARGVCKNSRLYVESVEVVRVSAADLKNRLLNL